MDKKKLHNVYVYGTLRPGNGEVHVIPGVIYDLGWYPGLKMLTPDKGKFVIAERLEVDDRRLEELDAYEGYDRLNPRESLYIRVPYLDGWVYIYNRDLDKRQPIPDGDWLKHRGQEKGVAA